MELECLNHVTMLRVDHRDSAVIIAERLIEFPFSLSDLPEKHEGEWIVTLGAEKCVHLRRRASVVLALQRDLREQFVRFGRQIAESEPRVLLRLVKILQFE